MSGSAELRVRCTFPEAGTYRVRLFEGAPGAREAEYVGGILVNARG